MIRYALACDHGHSFEAWFRSSSDFDGQAERGLLSCPACGSSEVRKALMAPKVVSREASAARSTPATAETVESAAAQAEASAPVQAANVPPGAEEIVARLRELKRQLVESSENVGNRFPEEARRMHYGEAPHRSVYGEASPDEARALIEEGVGIMPLPVLPEERN